MTSIEAPIKPDKILVHFISIFFVKLLFLYHFSKYPKNSALGRCFCGICNFTFYWCRISHEGIFLVDTGFDFTDFRFTFQVLNIKQHFIKLYFREPLKTQKSRLAIEAKAEFTKVLPRERSADFGVFRGSLKGTTFSSFASSPHIIGVSLIGRAIIHLVFVV
jgi:hypothetical protein